MTTDGVAAPGPAGARRRVRNLLLIVGAFVLVLGGIAGGTLFYFYDKATEIDRSTPRAVTHQILDAALVLRDETKVALFLCDGYSVSEALREIGTPAGTGALVSWGDSVVEVSGSSATVTVQVLTRTRVAGNLVEESRSLVLQLENQNGWRVCGITSESLDP